MHSTIGHIAALASGYGTAVPLDAPRLTYLAPCREIRASDLRAYHDEQSVVWELPDGSQLAYRIAAEVDEYPFNPFDDYGAHCGLIIDGGDRYADTDYCDGTGDRYPSDVWAHYAHLDAGARFECARLALALAGYAAAPVYRQYDGAISVDTDDLTGARMIGNFGGLHGRPDGLAWLSPREVAQVGDPAAWLRASVGEYSAWASGNVYVLAITRTALGPDGMTVAETDLDTYGGFYGDHDASGLLEAAADAVSTDLADAHRALSDALALGADLGDALADLA